MNIYTTHKRCSYWAKDIERFLWSSCLFWKSTVVIELTLGTLWSFRLSLLSMTIQFSWWRFMPFNKSVLLLWLKAKWIQMWYINKKLSLISVSILLHFNGIKSFKWSLCIYACIKCSTKWNIKHGLINQKNKPLPVYALFGKWCRYLPFQPLFFPTHHALSLKRTWQYERSS